MSYSMPRRSFRIMRALPFFISCIILASACGGTLDVVGGGPDGGGADSPVPDAAPPHVASPDTEWTRQIKLTRDGAEVVAGLGEVIAANETTIVGARTRNARGTVTDNVIVIETFEKQDSDARVWLRLPELSLETQGMNVHALALHGDMLFVAYGVWGYAGFDHQGVRRFRRNGARWSPIADLIPLAEQRICALAVNEDGRALARYASGLVEIYDASGETPHREYTGTFPWQGNRDACPGAISSEVAAITIEPPYPSATSDLITLERKDGEWIPHSQHFPGILHDVSVVGGQVAVLEAKVDENEPVTLAIYAKNSTGAWIRREDVFAQRHMCTRREMWCSLIARGSRIFSVRFSGETILLEKKDGQWSKQRTFTQPSGSFPRFSSAAFAGDHFVLGAPNATVTAEGEGAMYLYERYSFDGTYAVDENRKLLSASPTYLFGVGVAFSRREMLVADSTDVFVYELDAQGQPVYSDAFPHGAASLTSMVANEDTLVAARFGTNDLYMRRRLPNGRWGPSETLKLTGIPFNISSTRELAMDDDTIAEFVPWFYSAGGPAEDHVAIFQRTASGYAQEALQGLPSGDAKYGLRNVISVSKGRVLAASEHTQTARVYVRDAAGRWSVESDLAPSRHVDVFKAGALDGDRIVLLASTKTDGVLSDAAYVFERSGSTWRETACIPQGPRDYYGYAALSGDYLAIGSNLYGWQKGKWALQREIDHAGNTLVFSGDRLAIGRAGEDVARKGNAGAAYLLYRR